MQLRAVATVGVLIALVWPAATQADIGGKPDENFQEAYGPVSFGTQYSAAFTNANDIDYAALDIPAPNTSVHISVANTLQTCNSPYDDYCPVWATLVDGNGQQVGGEGSSAGTGEVDYGGGTDSIDWTFATPGRYYLVIEQSGDDPPPFPTYTFRVDRGTAGNHAHGGSSAGGPAGCIVPRLKGKKLRAARRALKRAHCRLGQVTHRVTIGPPGRVLAQHPRAHRKLRSNHAVAVVVSRR